MAGVSAHGAVTSPAGVSVLQGRKQECILRHAHRLHLGGRGGSRRDRRARVGRMADSKEAGAGRGMRRHVGALLMVAGTGLVLVTVLAGAGILPIWRPTVPEPMMLRDRGWAGLGAQGAARERSPAYAGEVQGLAGGETIAAAPRATASPLQSLPAIEADDATPGAA